MPRKKPFSMKQKKRQLKEKREKKRGEGDDLSPSHSRSASRDRTAGEHRDGTGTVPGQRRLRRHDEEEGDEVAVAAAAGTRGGRQRGGSDDDGGAGDDGGDGGDGGELPPRGPARPGVRRINEQPVEERRGGRHDPNRYRLHFAREGREEVERRKRLAQQQPLLPLLADDPTALEVTVDTAYPPGSVLDFPCRPRWSYLMTREEVRANEERAFRDYLARIHGAYPAGSLSYFEHNLETWRQLWRVLEMSDVILLITDVRHPVLHFCPSLHDHVVRQCGRSLVLVLNKVDLVEASLVSAWRAYFTARFPGTRVVCFTSRPDGGGGGVAAPGEVLARRRRVVKGGRRSALGPAQLLKACEAIVQGKVDLSSWAEKISAVDKEDDEDDDEDEEDDDDDEGGGGRRGEVMGGRTVRVEHLSDVAMGLPGAPTEPFKDGVLTVGCVGFPNVGKSSLINGLVGRKVVSVSRTPGHTKYFQTYFLTPTVRLCDCPGLIFPSLIDKQQQILAGIYPISQIQEPYTAIGFLAQRIPLPRILNLRRPAAPPRGGGTGAVARGGEELGGEEGEEAPWTAWEICEVWAEQRGFHTARTARPDVYRAANSILRLAVEGRLSLAMHPPGYTANHELWLTHPDTLEMQEMQERYRTLSTGATAPDATDRDDEEDDEDEDEEEEEWCSRNAFQILAGDDA